MIRPEEDNHSILQQMPDEILVIIFNYCIGDNLTLSTAMCLYRTCRSIRNIMKSLITSAVDNHDHMIDFTKYFAGEEYPWSVWVHINWSFINMLESYTLKYAYSNNGLIVSPKVSPSEKSCGSAEDNINLIRNVDYIKIVLRGDWIDLSWIKFINRDNIDIMIEINKPTKITAFYNKKLCGIYRSCDPARESGLKDLSLVDKIYDKLYTSYRGKVKRGSYGTMGAHIKIKSNYINGEITSVLPDAEFVELYDDGYDKDLDVSSILDYLPKSTRYLYMTELTRNCTEYTVEHTNGVNTVVNIGHMHKSDLPFN